MRPAFVRAFLLLVFVGCATPSATVGEDDDPPSSRETLASFFERRGLPFEDHAVQTSDGYILRAHRLPNPGAPVVYLQHGILADTWCWVSNTNELGIGQSLHAAGYDVWFGNSRGNNYGRNHTTLSVTLDREFWNFSFAEMGRFDIPATIEYIVEATSQQKIVYVGWSQGNTAMLIALQEQSLRNFLEQHVSLAVMLSPVAYMRHSRSLLLSTLSKLHLGSVIEKVFPYGFLSHDPSSTGISQVEQLLCKVTLGLVCKVSVDAVCGTSKLDDTRTITAAFTSHFPSGTSIHDLHHFEQLIGEFPSREYEQNHLPIDMALALRLCTYR